MCSVLALEMLVFMKLLPDPLNAIQAKVRTPAHIAQQLAPTEDRQLTSEEAPKKKEVKSKAAPDLLKLPPVLAQARRACMVCLEPVARGSIIYYQRGCRAFLCQGCASFMCNSRADSSGQDGSSNGELMCSTCSPHHPITPATLARTVPVPVFKKLQVRGIRLFQMSSSTFSSSASTAGQFVM